VLRVENASCRHGVSSTPVLDALAVGWQSAGRWPGPAARFVTSQNFRHRLSLPQATITLPSVRAKRLVRHDVRVQVANALGRHAGGEEVGVLIGQQRDLRIEQRQIEVLTGDRSRLACAMAAQMAIEAYMPVMMSATGTPRPLRSAAQVAPSGSPVTLIMPPMPWIMKS
jgi:hypothetical protein